MRPQGDSYGAHTVTVFVPGLTGREPWPLAWPRSLARFIARASATAQASEGLTDRTLELFGLAKSTGLAALARLGEGQAPSTQWWVRCDPVHLAVDGDRLLLVDNETVGLTDEEARRLSRVVTEVFAEENGAIEVLAPHRWYLTLPRPRALQVASLAEVTGRNIQNLLPEGDQRYWRTRLNEVQMVLHQALVGSHGGEGSGLCINSVWFWGPGLAPAEAPARFARVYTDDVLFKGAATLTHSSWAPTPASPEEFAHEGPILLVLRGAQGPVQYGDPEGWSVFLEAFVTSWLQPLAKRLAGGSLQELIVVGDRGPAFHLTRRDLWRFWRSWR